MKWLDTTFKGQRQITEWVKFRIADGLNLFHGLCWAQLSMWAMGYDPWWAILAVVFPRRRWLGFCDFRQECRWNLGSVPFCGKCFRDDRWLAGCTDEQKRQARDEYSDMIDYSAGKRKPGKTGEHWP